MAAAGDGPDINYDSEKASPAYIHEDTLTVAEFDRSETTLQSEQIEYYNDNGELEQLPAHYNDSQDEPVSVRYDRISADRLEQFPRVSGESGNTYSWLDTGNYTTSSGAGSSMTVSDADGNTASGVNAVEFDASVASTEWANATYAEEVNVSSDVDKRYLQAFFNVDSLSSSATVYVVVVDSDGDTKYVEIDDGLNAADTGVAANATGNGYVVQERLADLDWNGTGDGSWDEVQNVRIAVSDANAKITVTGLDIEQKSPMTLGTATDANDEDVTFEQINGTTRSGYTDLNGLDTMGSWADDAGVMELQIHDVRYSEEDLADSDDWQATFSAAENYTYDRKLEKDVRLQVPAAIDLSHGTLELRVHQGLVDERYATVEYATDTGDTSFENMSDENPTDKTSDMTNRGDHVVLATGVGVDANHYVGQVAKLQPSEEETLLSTGSGGGAPVDDGGEGFFSSAWGKITGAVMAVLGAIGARRFVE
jgi:hypothetical protein